MSKNIKNINLSFNCPFSWNELSSDGIGRYCNSCNHKVLDFTDKDEKYLHETLSSGEKVCGRFKKSQLSASFLKIAASSIFLSASLGINACSQDIDQKQFCEKPKQDLEFITMGIIIEEPPVPELGWEELINHLTERIKFSETFPVGKVFVNFEIDSTGIISNPRIIKSLTPRADEAVLKAFQNLEVRFIPARQGGKFVKSNYVLPFSIKNKT